MKPRLLDCSLIVAATVLLPLAACAAPHISAQARRHKPSPAASRQRPHPAKRSRLMGRAYILNAARPGVDPNRGDHMAIGRGMHPERMDPMNTLPPVAPAPKP